MIEDIIKRYEKAENNGLLKKRALSEQDITTKFVSPMLQALNWNPFDVEEMPEIHEKGFRERDLETGVQKRVKEGLPDFSLRRKGSEVAFFVEVKHPSLKLNPQKHLTKYRDGHLILLTSFTNSMLVRVGKNRKKQQCDMFIATSPKLYLTEFGNLWKCASNSEEGDNCRRALKSWRNRRNGKI
jgi:hypothetical protein